MCTYHMFGFPSDLTFGLSSHFSWQCKSKRNVYKKKSIRRDMNEK